MKRKILFVGTIREELDMGYYVEWAGLRHWHYVPKSAVSKQSKMRRRKV